MITPQLPRGSRMRTVRIVASLALASALGACSDGADPVPRASRVDFAALPDTLGVGDSLQLQAAALDGAGRPIAEAPLTWASRRPGVLAVTASGSARALATGDVWLVATVGGAARGVDSVRVEVDAESRSLRLESPADSLLTEDFFTFSPIVDTTLGAALVPGALRYTSSDTLVAVVNSLTGATRILGDGDVTIVATAGARTATVDLHAHLQTIPTGGVRLARIALGWGFGCGLDAAGVAYCWGQSNIGQLGRGTRSTGDAQLPFAPVSTTTRFTEIAAGRGGACGITTAGGVECWGSRPLTFLTPFDADERSIPRAITFPSTAGRIVRIDVGVRGALCAIDDAGANFCIGDNLYGALGVDSTVVRSARAIPGSPSVMQSIGTGEEHGCGATVAGALYCWGDPQSWGGGGLFASPALVTGLPAMRDVAANFQGTCALAADGTPWCGGLEGPSTSRTAMHPVTGAPALVRIESGMDNICGLTATGDAWCWGAGYPVLLRPLTPLEPVPLSRRLRFIDVGVGPYGICGLTANGAIRCMMFRGGFQ